MNPCHFPDFIRKRAMAWGQMNLDNENILIKLITFYLKFKCTFKT